MNHAEANNKVNRSWRKKKLEKSGNKRGES